MRCGLWSPQVETVVNFLANMGHAVGNVLELTGANHIPVQSAGLTPVKDLENRDNVFHVERQLGREDYSLVRTLVPHGTLSHYRVISQITLPATP